jgi:DNA-binding IscR family transcriptional regulator
MQISSRFTIAVHIFACIDTFGKDQKITSDFLSTSINVNPVIIRKRQVQRLMARDHIDESYAYTIINNQISSLKKSHLLNVQRGTGGTTIAKPLDQITLFDIYQSVECVENGELFHFHENPNNNCPVGKNIHNILDNKLMRVQKAMEDELSSITLKDVIEDTRFYVQQEMK